MEKISAAVAWRLADRLRGGSDPKQQQSGIAEFVRMDSDGTAWIRIPGNNFDTPVEGGVFVDAKEGDTVTYTISGGQASISGNATSPAVGGTYVTEKVRPVERKANNAIASAEQARTAADMATAEAGRASEAADAAQSSADDAATAAQQAIEDAATADGKAEAAATAASNAQTSANSAASAASAAQTSANSAAAAAAVADEKAVAAGNAAAAAQTSANFANTYANAALDQLGIVQDVIGVLTWATEHGSFTLTSDTTIVEGKVYFTYDSQTGDYTPVIDPQASALSTYYELSVDEAMESYIMAHLAVTSRGLWVLPSGIGSGTTPASGESQQDSDARQGSGYKTLLASDGSYVYDGTGALVARYGSVTEFFAGGKSMVEIGSSGARIGATDTSHVEIDYHSLRLIDKEGDTYFVVSDLRNSDGWVDIEEEIRPATSQYTSSTEFALSLQAIDANYVVTVDGVERTTGIRKYVTRFLFDDPIPSESSEIVASYRTESQNAKAFTFGSRFNNSDIGGLSFSEGYGVEASGTYSHAEGRLSHAAGYGSHAEGSMTWAEGYASHAEGGSGHAWGRYSHKEGGNNVASGHASHAEGDGAEASGYISHAEGSGLAASSYSHAEGYLTNATGQGGSNHAEGSRTTASGAASHAEGYRTTASGDYSHAGGEGTTAASDWQTTIGKYNEVDGSGRFPLIIGNGTDENNLSNALTVDWSGNVETIGMATVYSPTIEDNTTYSSNVGGNGLVMRNGSETFVGQIRAYARSGADRLRGLQIGGFNEAATAYNYLYLMVDKDGNRVVQVSEVAPWHDMLYITPSDTTMTIDTTNTTSIGNNHVRRSGKCVTVQFTELKIAAALANSTTSATLATIPSGYRPSWSVYAAAIRTANIGSSYWRIDSSGNLTLRNQSGASIAAAATLAGTITYIIA